MIILVELKNPTLYVLLINEIMHDSLFLNDSFDRIEKFKLHLYTEMDENIDNHFFLDNCFYINE